MHHNTTIVSRVEKSFAQRRKRNGEMSSTDELREVEVQIKGSEYEAQHGHQMSMGDRDPTSMNDHVKVRRKAAAMVYVFVFDPLNVKELQRKKIK